MSLFQNLYAHALANRDTTAKSKPASLTRKIGDASVKLTIETDPASLVDAESIILAAGMGSVTVGFTVPAGEAKVSKSVAVTAEGAMSQAAALMGVSHPDVEAVPDLTKPAKKAKGKPAPVPEAVAERGASLLDAAGQLASNGTH